MPKNTSARDKAGIAEAEESVAFNPYRCSACHTVNLPNTLFCDRCGHELGTPADSSVTTDAREEDSGALQLLANGQTITLPNVAEIVLGRGRARSEEQHMADLSTIGGIEAGVSREHAALRQRGGELSIEDLDSTNGTYVNRHRITPHKPVRLDVGDTIHLGKLKVKVVRS